MLKDAGDKVSESDKAPIHAAIEKVKQAASKDDVADIRRALGELEQAAHAMSQHLYSKQQAGPTPAPTAAPNRPATAKARKT